jgi:SAM-dependent methyltransferase
VKYFGRRQDLPDVDKFPEIWPPVASLEFPRAIVADGCLDAFMRQERIDAIRGAIQSGKAQGVEIHYAAPWTDSAVLRSESVDLVFSHAVLEHVEDVDATYDALFRWLKPGGAMSHQIDFRSHSLTRDWYGHWTVSPWKWRLVRGRRPYLINRLPASAHIDAMRRRGFEILEELPLLARPPARNELAAEFRDLSDSDLRTSGLFVIARKPPRTVRS